MNGRTETDTMDVRLTYLREGFLSIDEDIALTTTRELLAGGTDPQVILEAGLTEAMLELGRRWNRGEAYLPEVVAAAGIFEACSKLVEPALLAKGDSRVSHRMLLATVKGDLHDLGKNIVAAMMKTVGIEVHDLGKSVGAEQIVAAVRELQPSLVGLSALLTTTMPEQRATIQQLEAAGLRSSVKVMVGGAPVTAEWAEEIGADGYAPNAPESVSLALSLLEEQA